MLAYGATITPFGGNSYFTTAHEATRQAVNAWFRTNKVYDGVIDFDAVVRDPGTLTNLLSSVLTRAMRRRFASESRGLPGDGGFD